MQPNDDNLSEDNLGQPQSAPGTEPVGMPPSEPQPSAEPPLNPVGDEPQPMASAPETSPTTDMSPSPAPDVDVIGQPVPPVVSPPEQPVSFQPAADGEQPQPIQSVPVEPPKPEGFFGKIKSMFSKK